MRLCRTILKFVYLGMTYGTDIYIIQGMSERSELIPLHLIETSAHASDNCTTAQPGVQTCIVIYFAQNFILLKNLRITARPAQLHHRHPHVCTRMCMMCTSLTDHVTWSIS